ncbi:MAG: hypothetical protein H6744_00150 [Deltaproteobacteria bacterium]|nr:hypothetical protein [Deltaproteobacteria bacterium]
MNERDVELVQQRARDEHAQTGRGATTDGGSQFAASRCHLGLVASWIAVRCAPARSAVGVAEGTS